MKLFIYMINHYNMKIKYHTDVHCTVYKKQRFTDRNNQYIDFMKKFVLQTIKDHNDFFEIVNFVDKDKTNKLLNNSVNYSGFKTFFQLVQYF